VTVLNPDGSLKRDHLVGGLSSGDCGIGVDNRGNVYLGMNVKDPAAPLAREFRGQVPESSWINWDRERKGLAAEAPWKYPYSNPYLFHMGSVFKFGPEGGMVYGYQTIPYKGYTTTPNSTLKDAPPDAVPFKSGYLNLDVKISGAKWRYPGIGIVPSSGVRWGDPMCVCLLSQLDADPYGRVFAPSVFHSSVEMLDAAGNRIARIGAYGNADSAGPDSSMPEPQIAFAWPAVCDFAEYDGRLYVSDSVNRRIVVVAFDYEAEARCEL
jgi:hypothetical protein